MKLLFTIAIALALAMCANASSFRRVQKRCLIIGQGKKVHYDAPFGRAQCQSTCGKHGMAECVWWQKGSVGQLLQATKTRIARNCNITGKRGQLKFNINVSRQMCRKLCENHPHAHCTFNNRVKLQ